MITCGNLGDGKPCEWLGKDECERHEHHPAPSENLLSLWGADVACAPVLALLEARAESARWKRDEAREATGRQ